MYVRAYYVAMIKGGVSRNNSITKIPTMQYADARYLPTVPGAHGCNLDVLQAWRQVEPFHTN